MNLYEAVLGDPLIAKKPINKNEKHNISEVERVKIIDDASSRFTDIVVDIIDKKNILK